MTDRLTKEQAAIIGTYTGILCGPFSDVHDYAERVVGHPLFAHEFRDEEMSARLQEVARADFIRISYSDE